MLVILKCTTDRRLMEQYGSIQVGEDQWEQKILVLKKVSGDYEFFDPNNGLECFRLSEVEVNSEKEGKYIAFSGHKNQKWVFEIL